MAVRRGRSAGKARFDPCNLVPCRVSDYAPRIEVGISFPLDPVTLFAHTSNHWCSHGYGNCSIGVGVDYQDRALCASLAKAVSHEILFNEFIVLPPRF